MKRIVKKFMSRGFKMASPKDPDTLKKIQEDINQMKGDMRDTNNNVELIKGDTGNINRILTLSSLDVILNDLRTLIGKSETKTAILHLTKDKISAGELSKQLGIDPKNLTKYISPFVEKKAYISKLKSGTSTFFKRQDIIDIMNFEETEPFKSYLTTWKSKQNNESKQ